MQWIRRVFAIVIVGAFASAFAATYERTKENRDLGATPAPGRLISVGGHRLHLWCMGHGEPTVLFDSGLGGTAFDWYAVLQEVSSFTTACAYDRAGMGYSDPGPSPRTARQIARELGALIVRSEMKVPLVLVGWSYGGLFVRAYASQHEFQVAGLVLVDASHEDQANRFAAAGFPPNVVPWTERWASVAAAFGVLRFRRQPSLARLDLFPEPVQRFVQATEYRPSGYQTEYDEDSHESETFDEVRALRRPLSMPVVVLSAGKGPVREIWMPLQLDLLNLSKRSCQMVAVDSGHGIPYHAPEMVVRAVRAAIGAWSTSSPPACS